MTKFKLTFMSENDFLNLLRAVLQRSDNIAAMYLI